MRIDVRLLRKICTWTFLLAFNWKHLKATLSNNNVYVIVYYRGKDVSGENLHQGYTHVFESTFESVEGIAEYVAHPTHVEYANLLLPSLEKVLIIDYKPTFVNL